MKARLSLALLGLLTLSAPAGALDQQGIQTVTTAYAVYLVAQTYRDYCAQQDPTSAKVNAQAYAAWVQAQGLGQIEPQLSKLLGADTLGQLKAGLQDKRAALAAGFQKLGPAAKVCAAFRDQLKGEAFSVSAKAPGLGAVLAGGAGASGGSGSGSAGSGGGGSGAPGTVYSVAQLSTLAGQVLAAQPKGASGSDKEQAVLSRLRALGSPLVVTGTVPGDEGWLTQQDGLRTTRWDLRCYGFANDGDSLDPYHGKTVTLVGTLHDFDLSTFIELDDCRVLASSAGLKKSSLPVSPVGQRYLAQDPQKFVVAQGQGLKSSQILTVYTTQITTVGVGGMMIQEYEPYLFLKDGTVYRDPTLAPDSFNYQLSRKLEPPRWGRWTQSGKNFLIKWGDGDSETFSPAVQVKPAGPGLTLNGSFGHIGGGGNTAMGGDVMVASSSTYTFKPDGSFSGGSSASASTSNVVTGASKSTAGHYSVSGYTITLKYDNGTVKRLFFYVAAEGLIHIGGTDYLQ